jgi:hypothetical protein
MTGPHRMHKIPCSRMTLYCDIHTQQRHCTKAINRIRKPDHKVEAQGLAIPPIFRPRRIIKLKPRIKTVPNQSIAFMPYLFEGCERVTKRQ